MKFECRSIWLFLAAIVAIGMLGVFRTTLLFNESVGLSAKKEDAIYKVKSNSLDKFNQQEVLLSTKKNTAISKGKLDYNNKKDKRKVLQAVKELYFVPSTVFSPSDADFMSAFSTIKSEKKKTKEFKMPLTADHLADCIKYHFHQRKYFLKQRKHDPLAVRLQLDLISKQLCFSDINSLPSLKEFVDFKLTAGEDSQEAYISKFSHNDIQYFSSDFVDAQCRIISKIYFRQKGSLTGSGMGSRIHLLATQLHLVMKFNDPSRMLAFEPGGWVYTNSSLCKFADLRCYFQQMSQCFLEEGSLTDSDIKLLHSNSLPQWNDPKSESTRSRNSVLPFNYDSHSPHKYVYELPEIYASRGWLWYYAQIFYFILQPNEYLQQDFSRIQKNFKDHIENENRIFVHIRRGDKYTESPMFDNDSYIKSAMILEKNKEMKSSMFIATDDADVYDQLKQNYGKSFSFYHISRRVYTERAFQSLAHYKIDGTEVAMTIFREMFMAVHSDMFIGSFSSGLSRLLFKLMTAIQGEIPAHFSLSSWSRDGNGNAPELSIRRL